MKHVFIMLVLIAIAFLTIGAPAAQATVEEGWPVSQPNTPRHVDDFFIDFESGVDEFQIESTIPSLKFTTTSGLNWKYGDIRTDKYNVNPYGSKNYETRGNFFAWLGVTGDVGRIDFLGGGASYCSVLVSTSSGVTLDAYSSEDVKIATSGWANSNIDTGTLTRLTVDAPAEQTIAYVLIHDTGNFWLMDDLCTDANKAVIPVPGRTIGSHSGKFDIVFIPDEDYGSSADIDTWLPTFLDDINHQIDERLGGAAPVSGNLDKFNFYYTKKQGIASSKTLPADLTLVSPFTDAYVIFHTTVFGDSTSMGTPSIYGAEGPVGRSFIHESGHGIFGLADEYDGETFYFQPNPMPNIWATEAAGRADATNEGWDPDDIWKFTDRQGDWWKLGTTEYIMWDGTRFANGWGAPSSRRINWFLDQFPDGGSTAEAPTQSGEAIWLNLQVSSDVFSLLDDSYVIEAAPNYLPGKHDFTAKVFSTSGELLGEYGFNDPRRMVAESDYAGPKWIDSINFQLILPYYNNAGRVDLIESATGSVKLSVDISKYATTTPKFSPPVANAGADQIVEQANLDGTEVTLDGSGSTDPDGDTLIYNWMWNGQVINDVKPTISLPLGTTTVTLTVSDGQFLSTDTVDITVQDTTPPEITTSDEPIIFWAPNHKYETVSISDCVESVTDICDVDVGVDDIIITSVSSDEPEDSPDEGDGATLKDIVIVDPQTVDLRAERDETGNGRVYTINYKVTDASGNAATGFSKVWVPIDQSQGATVIDDSAAEGYTINAP